FPLCPRSDSPARGPGAALHPSRGLRSRPLPPGRPGEVREEAEELRPEVVLEAVAVRGAVEGVGAEEGVEVGTPHSAPPPRPAGTSVRAQFSGGAPAPRPGSGATGSGRRSTASPNPLPPARSPHRTSLPALSAADGPLP